MFFDTPRIKSVPRGRLWPEVVAMEVRRYVNERPVQPGDLPGLTIENREVYRLLNRARARQERNARGKGQEREP